ncbi:MAG: S8 family serine peptidase [Chloroflexi bacterium]|nr:S8 family serine peptidase [Chloroflexota bacterium]
MFRRFALPFLVAVVLLWPVSSVLGSLVAPPADKVSPWVLDATADGDQTDFLVVLAEQADLSAAYDLPTKQARGRFVRDALWETAQRSQASLRAWLDARDVPYQSFYIVNMLHVQNGDRALVNALAARSDVTRIEANPRIQNALPRPETSVLRQDQLSPSAIEWGVSKINAPDVWALGYTGQGVVVGGQDTGYDWDHPALKNQYRGWNGSTADHDYNWHDAVAGSPQPVDPHSGGHGTHTMGTVLGDDGGSNQIGVAPGAKWIGCRNMDSGGYGTPITYIECFQFFLAPYPVGGGIEDGDPDKAPDVTNNSWSCPTGEGCSWDTLQEAVEAQRAAGIMTVVSAGNGGSSCSSVAQPPGLYDASYSVGSTNGSDIIAGTSSRGPVTIDNSNRLKPDISAPGVTVRSSTPGGSYGSKTGTSMAAPHVAGAVALVWSARPSLRNAITQTEDILNQTALPRYSTQCGDPPNTVPNNVYGWGRLDALEAVYRVLAGHLEGTVNDDGGNPVVGAEIEAALNPALAWRTSSVTDGLYDLSVISGTFTITVAAPGYMPYSTTGVTVTAGSTTTLDVTLTVTPTHTISGHVRDVSTGLPLSAMVGLPGVTSMPTPTDPATGFYSLTVAAPVGSVYILRTDAEYHVGQERPITITGNLTEDFDLEPICLLVVDDDSGADYETYYTDALDRLTYSYNLTTTPPDTETLSHYGGVIWLTGNEGASTLTPADQTNLASYLDGGGRLFLSGQDIGLDIGATLFYTSYLHAAFDSDDVNVYTLTGLDLLSGLDVTISGGDGADNQLHPSDVEPVNGGVAVYDYPAPHLYGGVAYRGGTYRTVYFSFGYEGINSQIDQDDVMSATLAYLNVCGEPEPCAPISGADFAHVSLGTLLRETVRFTATVAGGSAQLPITYTWDFGDDSGLWEGNPITHIFPFAATTQTYTVTLTVTNACPSQQMVWQTVVVQAGQQPCSPLSDVDFDHTPPEPEVWETVTFTATAAAGTAELPITYTWNFGDGVTDTMQTNPITHVFPFATTDLTYTVSLTVANACPSQQTARQTISVRAETQVCPPVSGVDFDYTPLEPLVAETVAFTATAETGTAELPITYTWNFGDGVTNTLSTHTITHTFPFTTTNLAYTVSLTVANACPSQQGVQKAIMIWPDAHTVYLPLVLGNN